MKIYSTIVCLLLIVMASNAQNTNRDSIMLAKINAKGTYPLIKSGKRSAILPVEGINDKPDNALQYKLLFNFSQMSKDSAKMNRGLEEIGRIINLHIAAGIPKEKISIVIVAHGRAMFSILNAEAYQKRFKTVNPNTTIINELENAGAKIIACGQAMQFLDIDKSNLQPEIKIAEAAKVALSTYQLKGYVRFDIADE